MSQPQPDYLSFLLRLWWVNDEESCAGKPVWRASLEDPRTGQRQTFASLEELIDFLVHQTGLASSRPEPDIDCGRISKAR